MTSFNSYKPFEIITTNEDYNNHLKGVELPGTIVDLRSGKNTVMCSLTYQQKVSGLQLLSNTLRDYYNKGQYFDKIYILETTEPHLDMGISFLNEIEKALRFIKSKCPNTKFIFINGDIDLKHNIIEYTKLNSIDFNHVNCYGFSFGLLSRTRKRLTKLNSNNTATMNYNSVATKHFICMNAVSQHNRLKLIDVLHETNIIDKCHWSWLRRSRNEIEDNFLEKMSKGFFDFKQVKELDMSLDKLEFEDNQDIVDNFYYLTDSLIDIGIESDSRYQFITEKTWKPILYGKVSLFFNCQNYYTILKSLGFELYDEIFDYSFDKIEDENERLTEYYNELKRLSEVSIEELQKKIVCIEDKITRNRNHAWNCDLKTISPFKEYPTLLP
jgi:hypothetical protein